MPFIKYRCHICSVLSKQIKFTYKFPKKEVTNLNKINKHKISSMGNIFEVFTLLLLYFVLQKHNRNVKYAY